MFKHNNENAISTERLLLRQFSVNDADDMLSNWISYYVVQSNYGEPVYETHNEVIDLIIKWKAEYLTKPLYRWAIILKEANQCIDQIAFCRMYIDDKTVKVEYCLG